MYTWQTVHGENIVDISVKLLAVVFADVTRPTPFNNVMRIFICRFTSLLITFSCLLNSFYAKSIGGIAKVTKILMAGIQVNKKASKSLQLGYDVIPFSTSRYLYLQTTNDQVFFALE